MIREAKATDYVELQKLSFEDLGYECDAELVKIRLENLDPNNECVFVADVSGKTVGYVHIIKFNTLYYKSMANIQGINTRTIKRKTNLVVCLSFCVICRCRFKHMTVGL